MKCIPITLLLLLVAAFAFSAIASGMYRHARATRGICACSQCEAMFFGSEALPCAPWDPPYRKRNEGWASAYVRGAFFTFKKDPAGILPIRSVQAMAIVSLTGSALLSLAWAWAIVLRAIGMGRRRKGQCVCGYDLRGIPAGRCPECGAVSAPAQTAAGPRAE